MATFWRDKLRHKLGKWIISEDNHNNEIKVSEWWELKILQHYPPTPSAFATNPSFFSEPLAFWKINILEGGRVVQDTRKEVWERLRERKRQGSVGHTAHPSRKVNGSCAVGTNQSSPHCQAIVLLALSTDDMIWSKTSSLCFMACLGHVRLLCFKTKLDESKPFA